MKKLLLTLLLLPAVLCLQAQDQDSKWQLNGGIELNIPVFNMEINTLGTGLDLQLIYKASSKVDLTADAGFNVFLAKKEFVPTGLIPLHLGAAYWLNPKIFVFAKGGLGVYMLYTPGETVTKNFVGMELGPGFTLSKKFDLRLSYNGYQNKDGSFGFIGIRAGYFFVK
jgi:hypothetical protein